MVRFYQRITCIKLNDSLTTSIFLQVKLLTQITCTCPKYTVTNNICQSALPKVTMTSQNFLTCFKLALQFWSWTLEWCWPAQCLSGSFPMDEAGALTFLQCSDNDGWTNRRPSSS